MTRFPDDPLTRKDLDGWMKHRAARLAYEGLPADTPLTAREYLMVQKLTSQRPAYSLT